MRTLLIFLAFVSASAAYTVQQPTIKLLSPQGIQFSYPADEGTTLVAYHFSVNSDLVGTGAGQYNFDVSTVTDGAYVFSDTGIPVYEGDTVNYWVNVINSGFGYMLTDQTWTAASSSGIGGSSCSAYPCDASCDTSVPPCNGLIFEENWDTFDLQRWQHEITMSGGGNWEFQYYTNNRSNSYVRDNTLFIKPTLTADHFGEDFLSSGMIDLWGGSPADFCTGNAFWGCQRTGSADNYLNPVQSARIRTVNSFAFKYGKIEVEAKMPKGDWIWPAVWLLPRSNTYGGWPASGEIDIIESRGNIDLVDESGISKGNDNMGMTLHWGPFFPLNGYPKTTVESHPDSGSYADSFHTWKVDWTEDYIDLYVDDTLLRRVDPGENGFFEYGEFEKSSPGIDNPWQYGSKITPFDQEFYILLNVAVGGTNGFFSDSWTNTPPKPWLNTSPTAMKDFWLKKDEWYPTWEADVNNGENAAMQIRSIKVWAN